jgi:FkbM family methyltransferase
MIGWTTTGVVGRPKAYSSRFDRPFPFGSASNAAISAFPDAAIYSFEPQAEVVKRFKINLSDRPTVKVFCSALGNSTGVMEFYRHTDSQSSSVLPPADTSDCRFRKGHLVEKVEVTKLDTFFEGTDLKEPI